MTAPHEGQIVHVAAERWSGKFRVVEVTNQGYTLEQIGVQRGPKPWVVTWTIMGDQPRHAAYKTKEAAERMVAELEQRPDLWSNVQRRYPPDNDGGGS